MNMWQELEPNAPAQALFCLAGRPMHPEKWGSDVKYGESIGPLYFYDVEAIEMQTALQTSTKRSAVPDPWQSEACRKAGPQAREHYPQAPGAELLAAPSGCNFLSWQALMALLIWESWADVSFIPSLLTFEGLLPANRNLKLPQMPDSSDT